MKPLLPTKANKICSLTNGKDDFSAVVAFGYGPVQTGASPGVYRLNVYGRMNAIAVGMLYHTLNIRRIIPTGGKTGGIDQPSESALMAHLIQSKFRIPDSVFTLEEESMDTIYNIVHVANIIDQSPHLYQDLLFVALGFHLPRIQQICSLVKLNADFVAAECVVELRSQRHHHLLLQLLQSKNSSYATMLESQERGMRGIKEMPEYWLPPLGTLQNTQRLKAILSTPQIQSFLNRHFIDTNSISDQQLHTAISAIPRQFPN
jgi:uncharacterized SAM-binding protein YcdF (DUF218 family)